MNIKFLFTLFILFSVTSCSIFINKIDDDLLNEQAESYKKQKKKNTYCSKKSSFSLISENNRNQKIFKSFLEANNKKKLSYADKVVLWSLVQMNIRPDLSSPTSKMQFFIKINKKTQFYHVYSKDSDNSYPYLHALELILQKYRGHYSLMQLATLIDNKYPNQFYMTSNFAKFLNKNKENLNMSSQLKRIYIRGDETLKKNERIKKQKLSSLISKYLKNKNRNKYIVSNYLFSYKRNNLIKAECNYDMGLYSSSIYLIHNKVIQSNSFGLRIGVNNFMADSTQSFEKPILIKNTIYFKGLSQSRSSAMCKFSLPLNNNWDLWLLSSQSRDPGQHLFHLIEYGIQDMKRIGQIDNLLRFSRHLFLKNPIRLILESQRSNPVQLNELLKLNMPIYNAEKLARIWGHLNSKLDRSFIIDQRRPGHLTCH